ncbi:unnamed protein product [Closterium sp. NIES-54]
MGEVGDVSPFWVWGALSLIRDTTAGKLPPRTLRCVFLGFPTDAAPWQFLIFLPHVCLRSTHPPWLSLWRSPLIPLAQLRGMTSLLATLWSLAAPRAWRPSRTSSPPPQPVVVDSCVAGGSDTGGEDSGAAEGSGVRDAWGKGGA